MTNSRMNKIWRVEVKQGKYLRCWICKLPITLGGLPVLGGLTCDHVVPKSLGGENKKNNFRPAHFACNTFRGNSIKYRPTEKHLRKISLAGQRMTGEAL